MIISHSQKGAWRFGIAVSRLIFTQKHQLEDFIKLGAFFLNMTMMS